jgi:hypothetical protein
MQDTAGWTQVVHSELLNKCGSTRADVAMIISLKQLEKLCPVKYDSSCNVGAFICCTNDGDVVLKNNGKGMPYLDLRELEAEAVLSFAPEAALSFVQMI